MLARLLTQPLFPERSPERRQAVVLPFSRPKTAAPKADWWEKYPCTRMHGADFEAEFHATCDESF